MSQEDIPILVVDDAKFSSAIIAKALRAGGFSNVRFTNNPLQALRSAEKRPADILIADWLMPHMDGVELTRRIKKLDEGRDHFTYALLLTTRDDPAQLKDAFRVGVDDCINKAHLRAQLQLRVLTAQQMSKRQNDLLRTNRLLRKKVREMQQTDLVDPVTGLGNLKFTLERLGDTIRQAETRGGAACVLLAGIKNLDVIQSQYEAPIVEELMGAISQHMQQLVRPLDLVCRPEPDVFAVVTLQDRLEDCTAESFKRIFDSLYMRSFKTSEGYIPIVAGVSVYAADERTGYPSAKAFFEKAYGALKSSFDGGRIVAQQHDPAVSEE